MIRNYVQETSSAPGTASTINLAGAVTGRATWASQFPTGSLVYYGMDDGTQWEIGFGTFTTGTPNTLARTGVIKNSAGTTARLNFTGATQVFNDIPAERSVYQDQNQNVALPSALTLGGPLTTAGQGNNLMPFTTLTGLTISQTGSAGAIGLYVNIASTSSLFAYFTIAGGNIGSITTNGSNTFYNSTSDYRLKAILEPVDWGSVIDSVPVYHAEMKYGHSRAMFMAHELQAVIPDIVTGEKDGIDADGNPVYQMVDHTALVPIMWAEIQALRARLNVLERRTVS